MYINIHINITKPSLAEMIINNSKINPANDKQCCTCQVISYILLRIKKE